MPLVKYKGGTWQEFGVQFPMKQLNASRVEAGSAWD